MQSRFFISNQEKEKIFCTELVKRGVPFHRALEVARIIAACEPDERLTDEEIQLAKEVCKQWLECRERFRAVLQIR